MARSTAPAIDWREGDAARFPVGNSETFDIVTCHQELQFFADKPAATREMRRVLTAGGRLVLGTWQRVEEIPLMRDLQRVADGHLGTFVDQRHSFGHPDAIRCLLAKADFSTIRVETVTHTIRMHDGATIFSRLNTMAIVAMSAAAKIMTDERRAQVVAAITRDSVVAMQHYLDGNDLVWDLGTNIATARA
jgi:ubiquinone/menaquinone biosynthesis C-methylase UbiE